MILERFSGARKKERRESAENIAVGFVYINDRGFGFATVPGSAERIRINPEDLGVAFSEDKVKLEMSKAGNGNAPKARVVEVIDRAQREFVGALERSRNNTLRLTSRRINRPHPPFELVRVTKDKRGRITDTSRRSLDELKEEGVPEGHQVVLELVSWKSPNDRPKVRFVRTLGKNATFEGEMRAIPVEHGFSDQFPREVVKEAERIAAEKREITPEDLKEREDLRETLTFTIDPEDAKDFDDAISFKKLRNGNYEIGVHIADPTHYMQPGSAIDTEARRRGTSVYLPGQQVVPMLPEQLSNDLCSLNEGEDKRTFSVLFEINQDGIVQKKKTRIAKTLIHSDKRLTYQDAQAIIDTDTKKTSFIQSLFRRETPDELGVALKTVSALAMAHREKRTGQDIDDSRERDELAFTQNKEGAPTEIRTKERFGTMKVIEECMLLANETVAEHISRSIAKSTGGIGEQFSIFRVHPEPDPEKVAELDAYLADLGLEPARRKHWLTRKPQDITQQDIDRILKDAEGTKDEKRIQKRVFGMMRKALYSVDNIGHFALAMENYAHFTSPIRRYADIILHRILAAHLADDTHISPGEMSRYVDATVGLTHRAYAADDAESDAVRLMQVQYFKDRIGERRRGRIENITESGLHIVDRSTNTYGLLPTRALGANWKFEKDPRRLVNKDNPREQYRLRTDEAVGIRMQAKEVDLAKRHITWDLASK